MVDPIEKCPALLFLTCCASKRILPPCPSDNNGGPKSVNSLSTMLYWNVHIIFTKLWFLRANTIGIWYWKEYKPHSINYFSYRKRLYRLQISTRNYSLAIRMASYGLKKQYFPHQYFFSRLLPESSCIGNVKSIISVSPIQGFWYKVFHTICFFSLSILWHCGPSIAAPVRQFFTIFFTTAFGNTKVLVVYISNVITFFKSHQNSMFVGA